MRIRFRPLGLIGRLMLVLIAAVVIDTIGSEYLHLRNEAYRDSSLQLDRTAERLVLGHRVLSATEPDRRPAIARALSILSFQDETNLTGFMGVFTELERLRHESLSNANTIELTPAKLPAETVHSDWRTHSLLLQRDGRRREYQPEAPCVLYVYGFMFRLALCDRHSSFES